MRIQASRQCLERLGLETASKRLVTSTLGVISISKKGACGRKRGPFTK